jgi:hypothetical protein
MPRRPVTLSLLVVAALILGVASAGRPSTGYAAVALKPGDIVIASGEASLALDPANGAVTILSTDPHFRSPSYVATGPGGEVYV